MREPVDSSNPADSFSRTLAEWRVTPPRNPAFRAQVQSRRVAGAQPWSAYARRHAALVAGAVAVALAAGAFAGQGRAHARAAAESARLATAYVEGLDARTMAMR